MRDPVTFYDLDDLEESLRAASPAQNIAAATDLVAWAEDPHPDDTPFPGDLLVTAADLMGRGGDLEGALALYRRAAELGTSEGPDPRAYAVEALFALGRQDEARAGSEELRHERPDRVDTYLAMATAWESQGELRQGMAWCNRGLALAEAVDSPPADLGMLALTRWRIRQALGMDPDEYDELGMGFLDAINEEFGEASG